jgi:hypothetical protein
MFCAAKFLSYRKHFFQQKKPSRSATQNVRLPGIASRARIDRRDRPFTRCHQTSPQGLMQPKRYTDY